MKRFFDVRWSSVLAMRILTGVFLMTGTFVMAGFAQVVVSPVPSNAAIPAAAKVIPVRLPLVTGYKEVKIGASADEVREKLGKAKIDDPDGFYYRFDDEFAQIRLAKDGKVRLISVTYSNENKSIPSFADVFGADAPAAAAKPDGSIYRLIRYPEAGYWVAYSRTAGNDPSVTVTIQKL